MTFYRNFSVQESGKEISELTWSEENPSGQTVFATDYSSLRASVEEWLIPETAAAVAAKSLQSCPILCDPIDGGPLGSS